jgi:biotin transporter BioY
MVKTPALYRLSLIYHFWHFWCDFCNFCVFFFIFLYFLGAFFLHFLLPPIVKVDISDIAIISVIPDMVKAIISGITNTHTPQKTYRIAQ